MKLEEYFKDGKIPMLKDYQSDDDWNKNRPYFPEITSLCSKVVRLPR